jgi:hypothetical protein
VLRVLSALIVVLTVVFAVAVFLAWHAVNTGY